MAKCIKTSNVRKYNVIPWLVLITTAAVETQKCNLCACVCVCVCVELHDTVKYIKTLSAAQQCFYGKFMSPTTIKRT